MLNVKKSLALLSFAGAALVVSASAHAAVVVSPGNPYLQVFGGIVGKNPLDTSYSFSTTGGVGTLRGFSFSTLIKDFTVSLSYGGSPLYTATSPLFQFSNLAAGDYSLNFSGTGRTNFFSNYGGAFKVMVAAVPEATTVAMALMAAGLLGGLALRKRKS